MPKTVEPARMDQPNDKPSHNPCPTTPEGATTVGTATEGLKWVRAGGMTASAWGDNDVVHWSGRRLVPIAETPTQRDKLEGSPEPGSTVIPAFLLKDHQAQDMSTPPTPEPQQQQHPPTKPADGALWINPTWRDKPHFKALEADPAHGKKMFGPFLDLVAKMRK